MAPARVRGCVGSERQARSGGPHRPIRLADASRRPNGPRKATSCRPITVRLRSKSCPAGGPDGRRAGRRSVVANQTIVGREILRRRMWGRRPGRPGGRLFVPLSGRHRGESEPCRPGRQIRAAEAGRTERQCENGPSSPAWPSSPASRASPSPPLTGFHGRGSFHIAPPRRWTLTGLRRWRGPAFSLIAEMRIPFAERTF